MRKQKDTKKIVRADEIKEGGILYRYTLFVTNSSRVASYGISLYSMRVEMTDKNGGHTETETGDIFADFGKALVFYERLRDNLATPIDLAYVLEDAITI